MKIYDEEKIFEVMRVYTNLSESFKGLHADMTSNYNMTVPKFMWDKDAKTKLEYEDRPASAYNLIRPVLRALSSLEITGRKKVVAKPESGNDVELAQVVTHLLNHFLYKANFDQHKTRAFLDAIIARYGMLYVGWNFADDPLGTLEIASIDPRRVMFEPDYADAQLVKCGYVLDRHPMSVEELINKYALKNNDLQDAIIRESKPFFFQDPTKRNRAISSKLKTLFSAVFEIVTDGDLSTDNSQLSSKYQNWFNPISGKFDTIEFHEKRTERRMTVYSPSLRRLVDITEGALDETKTKFDNEKIDIIKRKHELQGEPQVDLVNLKWITTIVPALRLKVLDKQYPIQTKYFMHIPVFCYDYHADLINAQSVMDDLKDPQSDYNKARSTKLELLQRYISKGWVLEEGAIDGYEEDWTSGNLAPFRRIRSGYWNKIRPEEMNTINPELIRETQELPELIQHISGANKSMIAEPSPEVKSGRQYNYMRNQSERSFGYIFQNVDNTVKAVASTSLAYIQKFVTAPRVFRITENDEPVDLAVNQKVVEVDEYGRIVQRIVNDVTIGKYDIEIDETPYGTTAREIEFVKFQDMFQVIMQLNPNLAVKLLPIYIKASNTGYRSEIMKIIKGDNQNFQEMALRESEQRINELVQRLGLEKLNEEIKGQKIENENLKADFLRKKLELIHGGHINKIELVNKFNALDNMLSGKRESENDRGT